MIARFYSDENEHIVFIWVMLRKYKVKCENTNPDLIPKNALEKSIIIQIFTTSK